MAKNSPRDSIDNPPEGSIEQRRDQPAHPDIPAELALAFVASARCRSYAQADRELGWARGTCSRLCGRLEALLAERYPGRERLLRVDDEIVLTQYGKEVLTVMWGLVSQNAISQTLVWQTVHGWTPRTTTARTERRSSKGSHGQTRAAGQV